MNFVLIFDEDIKWSGWDHLSNLAQITIIYVLQ